MSELTPLAPLPTVAQTNVPSLPPVPPPMQPMQAQIMQPPAAPPPWHDQVVNNFQAAHGTLDGLANDFASGNVATPQGEIVPQRAIAGRWTGPGGGGTAILPPDQSQGQPAQEGPQPANSQGPWSVDTTGGNGVTNWRPAPADMPPVQGGTWPYSVGAQEIPQYAQRSLPDGTPVGPNGIPLEDTTGQISRDQLGELHPPPLGGTPGAPDVMKDPWPYGAYGPQEPSALGVPTPGWDYSNPTFDFGGGGDGGGE